MPLSVVKRITVFSRKKLFAYKTVLPLADEEVPERFQRAEQVFEQKLWREQLREWDETFKPASIKTHRELQAVDPEQLSDEELVAHLTRCRDHHIEMVFQHMRFTGAAMVAIGDFLAHVGDWTGLPPADLLGLMRGAAPVSAGASTVVTLPFTISLNGMTSAPDEGCADPGRQRRLSTLPAHSRERTRRPHPVITRKAWRPGSKACTTTIRPT